MLLTPLESRDGFEPRRAVVFTQDTWTPAPPVLKELPRCCGHNHFRLSRGFANLRVKRIARNGSKLRGGRMRLRIARCAEFFALPALNRLHDVVGDFIYWPVLFYDQGIMGRLQSRQLAIEQFFWEEMSRSLLEAFGEYRFVDV